MRCPACKFEATRVIDSREIENSIRRRRECLKCGYRFTTYERLETPTILVVKKDGRREMFDREKILRGVQKACEKRPISAEQIDQLVSEIEREIIEMGETEVHSKKIGELVSEKLKDLDEVAYIRFASVYRQFKDIKSFERELQKLKEEKENERGSGKTL